MKTLERRINAGSEVKLETRAEGQPQVITGIGAVCYDGTPNTEYVLWDYDSERAVERILPGAFDKALSRPDDVRGLFNHNPDHVLGRTASGTMKLVADKAGLYYEITPGNTTVANDVKEHLQRKDVNGSSIAFMVDEERWTETKSADGKWTVLREILSLALADTGPVTFPAYKTTTAGVRAVGEPDEAKRSLAAHRAKKGGKVEAPTTEAIVAAADKATAACSALAKMLNGVDAPDFDAMTSLAAVDMALDQCGGAVSALLGDDPASAAAADPSADNRSMRLRLAELE